MGMMLHSISRRPKEMGREGQGDMREQPKQAESKANEFNRGTEESPTLIKRMWHQDMMAANN